MKARLTSQQRTVLELAMRGCEFWERLSTRGYQDFYSAYRDGSLPIVAQRFRATFRSLLRRGLLRRAHFGLNYGTATALVLTDAGKAAMR